MRKAVLVILLMFLIGSVLVSCEDKAAKIAKAKELLNRRCNKCHFQDKIYKKKYTKSDWDDIVKRMISYSKESPSREQIEISHEDAYEILLFLQQDSGD